MKKLLFLSLLLSGFISGTPSLRTIIHFLIAPIASIDSETERDLRDWHGKGDYTGKFLDDLIEMRTGDKKDKIRKEFPHNSSSVNKLSKINILFVNGRLDNLLEGRALISETYIPVSPNKIYKIYTSNINYEDIWQQQPLKDRLWWTLRYRRPYTYGLSLAKWGAEFGALYGVYCLVQWYKNRANPKLHISA